MSNIRCRNNGVRANYQPPSEREGDRGSGGRSLRNCILALVKFKLINFVLMSRLFFNYFDHFMTFSSIRSAAACEVNLLPLR